MDLPRSTKLLSGPSHAQNLVKCDVFGEPYAQNLVKYDAFGAPNAENLVKYEEKSVPGGSQTGGPPWGWW